MTVFNEEGPVYGPNGEWELDPYNWRCAYTRPVFATCKNNCPGGEFSANQIQCEILFILFSVNFPIVGGRTGLQLFKTLNFIFYISL